MAAVASVASISAAASIASAASAVGTGGAGAVTSSSALGKAKAETTAIIPAGTVINFGDQQQNLETLLQASGALKGATYSVNFVEFNSGPLVDAGFAAHSIDVGFMGDLPASLAAQSKLPVKAVAVNRPIGASEFLLAKPGITKISQLKGRPVAYTTGTAEQAFALRALASAGLKQKDVNQVNVSLFQLGTVLQSGAADASVVSVEQKVDYEQTNPGAKVLATIDSVKPPSYTYVLATTSALANSAKQGAISDLTARLIKAASWEKSHQSQFITNYYVNVEHQTPAAAKQILAAGGISNYVPITASVQSALQNVVTLMASAGAIPTTYSVTSLFNPTVSARYNNIVKETSHA